nr:skin secretory protein xP2-like [Aegilops tauschii subsp. strangulata]
MPEPSAADSPARRIAAAPPPRPMAASARWPWPACPAPAPLGPGAPADSPSPRRASRADLAGLPRPEPAARPCAIALCPAPDSPSPRTCTPAPLAACGARAGRPRPRADSADRRLCLRLRRVARADSGFTRAQPPGYWRPRSRLRRPTSRTPAAPAPTRPSRAPGRRSPAGSLPLRAESPRWPVSASASARAACRLATTSGPGRLALCPAHLAGSGPALTALAGSARCRARPAADSARIPNWAESPSPTSRTPAAPAPTRPSRAPGRRSPAGSLPLRAESPRRPVSASASARAACRLATTSGPGRLALCPAHLAGSGPALTALAGTAPCRARPAADSARIPHRAESPSPTSRTPVAPAPTHPSRAPGRRSPAGSLPHRAESPRRPVSASAFALTARRLATPSGPGRLALCLAAWPAPPRAD